MQRVRGAAFTLVELAIVLVIIGMIIGAVLAGQELVRQAQLRRLTTDVDSYRLAYQSFQVKYNCVAGDCAKATHFFGAFSIPCGSGGVTEATTTGACNGNGNGIIEGGGSPERYQFWKQLGNAGMIRDTNLSGIMYQGCLDCQHGDVNVPRSSYNRGLVWHVRWGGSNGAMASTYFSGNPGIHYVQLAASGNYQAGVLQGEEMFLFDQKYDDAKPMTGRIRSAPDPSQHCILPSGEYRRPTTSAHRAECGIAMQLVP